MEKKNWFNEKTIHNNDINKYFNSDLPIKFDKIQKEFNIEIIGCNFDVVRTDKKVQEVNNIDSIAGMVSISDDKIVLYYNNNDNRFDKKEQRFILANLFAYCINLKKDKKKSVVKDYDFMMKCDKSFEGMNIKEFEECTNNKMARQILMPKKQFELRCMMLAHSLNDEGTVISGLSYLFMVPEREVIIRCNELGINFNVIEEEKEESFVKEPYQRKNL